MLGLVEARRCCPGDSWLRTARLALLLCASGCFPYAYVLPPLDLGADVGVRGGSAAQPQVSLNVATRPLALIDALHHRRVDFGLGYTVMLLPGPLAHGPSAEVTHFLVEIQTSETFLWRLRAGLASRLLSQPNVTGFGNQTVARFVFEGADFVSRDSSSNDRESVGVSHAHGELGFGLYTELGVLALPTSAGPWAVSWTLTTGLLFTLPASAGVGLLWWR